MEGRQSSPRLAGTGTAALQGTFSLFGAEEEDVVSTDEENTKSFFSSFISTFFGATSCCPTSLVSEEVSLRYLLLIATWTSLLIASASALTLEVVRAAPDALC